MPDVTELKRQLRRSCRQIRKELGEETCQQRSLSICGWIESWPVFQRTSVILAYMPISGEVDLTPLMDHQPQKHWVLPRIIPEENHRMVFHPYDARRLVLHPFGMAEPAPDLPIIPSSKVQLALVPGLAFDRWADDWDTAAAISTVSCAILPASAWESFSGHCCSTIFHVGNMTCLCSGL